MRLCCNACCNVRRMCCKNCVVMRPRHWLTRCYKCDVANVISGGDLSGDDTRALFRDTNSFFIVLTPQRRFSHAPFKKKAARDFDARPSAAVACLDVDTFRSRESMIDRRRRKRRVCGARCHCLLAFAKHPRKARAPFAQEQVPINRRGDDTGQARMCCLECCRKAAAGISSRLLSHNNSNIKQSALAASRESQWLRRVITGEATPPPRLRNGPCAAHRDPIY